MQKIKDGLYDINDLVQTGRLALEKINITECACVETVLKTAEKAIDDLLELVEEMDLKAHKK